MYPISVCHYLRYDYSLSFDANDINQLNPNRLEPLVRCRLTLLVSDGVAAEYLRNTDFLASIWADKDFPMTCECYVGQQSFFDHA